MDTTVRDPLVGRLIDGRYHVVSRIARGGMATVYVAVDRRLDREVALKVMHPHLTEDAGFVARFVQEARSAARLSHPSVVAVFDQGADHADGFEVLYLAMELLPGNTLRDVIAERGALTPREAFTVIEPVLDALTAAHRAGIIHRDIKPENVILTDDGRVKVADFGLAKALSGGSSHTGALIGTVAYLAPELVSLGVADARSDVYAAGIMLFEMLTGRQPFVGEVPMQVAYRHVHEDVPKPSSIATGLPTEVDDVVLAAVARDPDERAMDAAAWLAAVRRVHAELADDVLDARPARPLPATPGQGAAPIGMPTEVFTEASPADAPASDRLPTNGAGVGAALSRPRQHETQSLPRLDSLRALRERTKREAREDREEQAFVAGSVGADVPVVPGAGEPIDPVDQPDAAGLSRRGAARGGREGRGDREDRVDPSLRRLAQQRRQRGLIGLAIVLGAAALLGLGGWWLVAGPGAFTTTPNLGNLTAAEAKAALAKQGLGLASGTGEYSEAVAKDRIVRTEPAAGHRVRKNGTVTVVLSLGTANRTVPKLVGKSREQALAALNQAGLKPGRITTEFTESAPKGQVIGTRPGSGNTVKVGSSVALTISNGPPLVDVPDVLNQWIEDAKRMIVDAGLQFEIVDEANQDVEAGRVFFQDPGGDLTAPKGSKITIKVSLGAEVQVPEVEGKSFDEAKQILEGMGFQVVREDAFGGFLNQVRRQRPKAGATAPPGSTITLTVV